MSKERMLAYLEKLYGITKDIEDKLQNEKVGDKEVKKMTGTDFEKVVYDSLIEAGFEKEEITHSTQKFPDFILEDLEDGDKIGVEVKKTDSSRWEVIGGSVYESLKNEIEDTYVLMAKLGGEKPEVRLKKYEECIADLKVTHSPRFYLNLDLEEGEDYLTQNDAKDLLELSGDELNKKIRKLLRTQKSTWWSEGETVAFADLSQEEKGIYLNEGIALFPEVFKGDYSKFTPWLVYSCFVWCGNVRDGILMLPGGGNELHNIAEMNLMQKLNRNFMVIVDKDSGAVDYEAKLLKQQVLKSKVENKGGELVVLRKREIENYYHPRIVLEKLQNEGIDIDTLEIQSYDDVQRKIKDIINGTQIQFKIKNNMEIFTEMSIDDWREISTYSEDGEQHFELEEIVKMMKEKANL